MEDPAQTVEEIINIVENRVLDENVEYLAKFVKMGVFESVESTPFDTYIRVIIACAKDSDAVIVKYHGLYVKYLEMYCPTMTSTQYAKFSGHMARLFNYVELFIPRCIPLAFTAASIRERFEYAASVIARALWRRVQRRQQMELLDELYRPGGLGALRAQQRFEAHQAAEDTL